MNKFSPASFFHTCILFSHLPLSFTPASYFLTCLFLSHLPLSFSPESLFIISEDKSRLDRNATNAVGKPGNQTGEDPIYDQVCQEGDYASIDGESVKEEINDSVADALADQVNWNLSYFII